MDFEMELILYWILPCPFELDPFSCLAELVLFFLTEVKANERMCKLFFFLGDKGL